jgi:hypothetical protein
VGVQDSSKIYFENSGTYSLTFSVQLTNTENNTINSAVVWLRYKGTDWPLSASHVDIPGARGGTPGGLIATVNFVATSTGDDYVEIYWQTQSNNVGIVTYPATATYPASPAIILTVAQVMSTQVGPQGPQGLRGETGNVNPLVPVLVEQAEQAAASAKNSQISAENSAVAASVSAEQASSSAVSANTNASIATNASISATASASLAADKAQQAATSQASAAQSANQASTSLTTSQQVLVEVEGLANSAENSAIEAANSAVSAQLSAQGASADRVSTDQNKAIVSEYKDLTVQAAIQAQADRVQTGLDRAVVVNSREQALTAANNAKASEVSSASNAASALQSSNSAAASASTSLQNANISTSNKETVTTLLAAFRGVFLGIFENDSSAENFALANSITLADGIMYQNSTLDKFRIYNGNLWQDYDSSAQVSQSAAALSAAAAAVSEMNARDSATTSAADRTQTGLDRAATVASEAAALQARNDALAWAASPEDQEITEGSGDYSALHWAAKSVTSQGIAGAFASTAVDAAQAAEQALADAVAVVTGGTASLTAEAGKLPIAGASGVLDETWTNPIPGVNAAALHRSPNAVTAMFIYDTSKDSDGGAWTERCQHTSWYNETLNGRWLGAQASEANARNVGATLGAELVTNGSFDTDTAWTNGTGWTIAGGVASKTAGTATTLDQSISLSTAKTYRVSVSVSGHTGGSFNLRFGSSFVNTQNISANGEFLFYLAPSSPANILQFSADSSFNGSIDNISVREVTAQTTQTGDYFQLTTDGKFYRLWKNLVSGSETPSAFASYISGGTTSVASVAPPSGIGASAVVAFAENTANSSHVCALGRPGSGTANSVGSAYIKAGGRTRILIGVGGGVSQQAQFDLSTGLFVGASNGVVATAAGDGWYRLSRVNSGGSIIGLNIYAADDAGNFNYTGDGRVAFYVTAGQFEENFNQVATAYEAKAAGVGSTTEVFRGNKRDFPRLAGIVAESNNSGLNRVSIYDLTEQGRPMWMSATSFANNYSLLPFVPGVSGVRPTSIFAINGIIATGFSGLADRYGYLRLLRFPADAMQSYSNGSNRVSSVGIALRNTTLVGFPIEYPPAGSSAPGIVNGMVNAVAMTVLPDAPVEPVTGLKVPTIAVATAGGVSVIKHDGTVRNLSIATNTNLDVAFNGRTLYVSGVPVSNLGVFSTTDVGGPAISVNNYFSYFGLSQFDMTGINIAPQFKYSPTTKILATRPAGSIRYLREHYSTGTRSVSARIDSTFNTGWKVGDARRAYLADVGAGSVTGPKLATTNPDFSTGDLTGWDATTTFSGFAQPASAIVTGGAAVITGPSSNYGCFGYATAFATTAGKLYAVRYKQANAQRVDFRVGSTYGGTNIYATTTSVNAALSERLYVFVATGTVAYVSWIISSNTVATFDDFSFQEVVADRSYKAQVANITGTLNKSEVAQAAQLVAYSSFSAANYLREPYSADLDFGTGEWSCSAFVNVPTTLPVESFPAISSELIIGNPTTSGGATYLEGVLSIPGTSSTGGSWQLAGHTAGKTYKVTFEVLEVQSSGNSANIRVGIVGNAGIYGVIGLPTIGVKTVIFTATQANIPTVTFQRSDPAVGQTRIGSVSVVEIGAAQIVSRSYSTGPHLDFSVTGSGRLTATAFDGTTTRTVTTTQAYNTGTWIKAEADYTTDGTLSISVNGVEVAATRGNPLLTLNNSNAVLTIGNSFALDAPFPGSIALLKLSATVPTAEQSVWMYEQEKQMFREGAQVCLPDAGAIADLAYDDATDKWIAVSAANESEWSGLVRTSVTPVPAGSYTRAVAASGVQMLARSTTSPGVDITIPAYGLREELVKRAESAARLNSQLAIFDYIAGFTANLTNGNTAITGVAGLTYPTSSVGTRVVATGIPANTTVSAVTGTTLYLSSAATATASSVQVSFVDFVLPVGMETKTVSQNGVILREGVAYSRLFDGFKETIRLTQTPSNTAWVQIQAVKSL